MTDQNRFDLTRRETFTHFSRENIRFSDTDKLGHVNNVSAAAYVETARCELIYGLLEKARLPPNIDFVLARVAIDFKREFFYPGTVEIGARFIRLGNRSVTSGYGLFVDGACKVIAESVNVFFDLDARVAIAPPPGLRALLEAEVAR